MPPLSTERGRLRLPVHGGAITRREFMTWAGAAMALAQSAACKQPREEIVPYARPPLAGSPPHSRFYATAITLNGTGLGLLVRSDQGRPTKIEGNPDHPTSLGATDVLAQAALRDLYDPARSRAVLDNGNVSSFGAARRALRAVLGEIGPTGEGLHVVCEPVVSPTLAAQREEWRARYPQARWHAYTPFAPHAARSAAQRVFGRMLDTHYRLDRAKVIVAIESDLLCSGAAAVRYAHDFARARRIEDTGAEPRARLYALESMPTGTGAAADHRIALSPAAIGAQLRALEARLTRAERNGEPGLPWIAALADDLDRQRGASAIVAGASLPVEVHAIVHRLNQELGNIGRTVIHTASSTLDSVDPDAALRALIDEMNAGGVRAAVFLGVNPAYTASSALGFEDALLKVPFAMHCGAYHDETARLCRWHVPEAHVLESWGDTRAHDGTVSLVQPLIEPLYDGHTYHELVAAMLSDEAMSPYSLVRAYWQRTWNAGDGFEARWRSSLRTGVIAGTAFDPVVPPPAALPADEPAEGGTRTGRLELVLRPDPHLWDGRFATNLWLQECPKPISKLTWDNALFVAAATAAAHGLSTGDVVKLRYRGREARAPVYVLPGHAPDCATLHFGYGRRAAADFIDGVGVNAFELQAPNGRYGGPGLRIVRTGERYELATTQSHHRMAERDLVRRMAEQDLRQAPSLLLAHAEQPPRTELYDDPPYDRHAWGMVIDLDACTGCNACVVACQAENNVPVVGKEEVLRSREMHWLRIDTYFDDDGGRAVIDQQPVLCMHCERAPCELVCPVGATVHSSEGLNDMVYNRCVGTRYCSNNCPYKVRRFNFFTYAERDARELAPMFNPEVTVRSRGVMEKCTYCVQRIESARLDAAIQRRPLRDGDVVTACQAACPSGAIVFGDLNDRAARVHALRRSARNYSLLAELGTEPRTTYLARVPNPNPDLDVKAQP